ncbi:hypothetical protein [Pedobacter sp. SYSU D00535]|uniref:TolB family protein n=1 Tax=Pedobacter sp. SYSU D00535 TaxID=2810308 RepID=UPI001A95FC50|nr:hypothetical protein [Pedobacter sp. SYSU D00535]
MCKIKVNKQLIISVVLAIILIKTSGSALGQVFSANQNPSTIKFRQINTENFQIIYPTQFENEANRMANVLDDIIKKVASSLKIQPKKISIILQNQGITSNGFVQLAPRRSEFFTTPSQNFDYQNWLNSLAVHELRHVVQFDKLSGKLSRPFFESLALSIFGINLPPWFFEGDAVGIETALTKGGRGRIPEWFITFRTNTLFDRNFSYSKNFLGSLKDFTPGYYQLGFFMTSKLKRDHGAHVMDSILSRVARLPFRPYNLSNSIKLVSGVNSEQLHDSTVSELKQLWTDQLERVDETNYTPLNKRADNTPESLNHPQAFSAEGVLYLLSSKAQTPSINLLSSSGRTRKIIDVGLQENPWFHYAAGKIVWDEFRYDARYLQRSFNVINVYDFESGRARQLTHKTRLFAPALSPDGERIITIEVSYANEISIVELSAVNGREINRYRSPNNYMAQMPSYNPEGNKIVFVAIANTGKMLYELDQKNGGFKQLTPLQLQEINKPIYAGDQIVFKGHYNGIDNLYRLEPATRKVFQITSAKTAAVNPSFDSGSNRLLFNYYAPEGYDISAIKWSPDAGVSADRIENTFVNYAEPLVEQEGHGNIFENVPNKKYASKPFRDINNLFYFHSAIPLIEQERDDYKYGVQLQSDNLLNTLSFYAGYQFNNSLKKSEYFAGFDFKRYLPIFSLSYVNRPNLIYRTGIPQPVTWRENEYTAEVSVPLVFNKFNNTYTVRFRTGTSYSNKYNIDKPFPNLPGSVEFPVFYQINASRNNRRAAQDLAPRWGQSISLTYRHLPFEDRIPGEMLALQSNFFFPAPFRNHSLQASFNWRTGNRAYRITDIPQVTGYSFLTTREKAFNTFLLDYRFPILYPDWELGPLAYIKRFKGGFFADFENIEFNQSNYIRSFGAELRADMNLLRFYLPNFDIGGRIIFLNEKSIQKPIFEFLATYNF